MSYNLSDLNTFTDEMSFELISKAVLQTNVMDYVNVRSGLKSGTSAINLIDLENTPAEGENPEKPWVSDRSCGWDAAGQLSYTQVDITMAEKQTKLALCPTDLRDYYLSQKLSASAHAEEVPFAEVVSNLFVEKIRKYNEEYIASEIFTQVTVANGAADSLQTTASTVETILDDVLNLIDVVPAKADSYANKAVLMSPTNFNMLRRKIVASNLFHFDASANTSDKLEIPGTDYVAVKGSFTGPQMIAGPMDMIVVGVGLEDDFDTLKIFYSADNDEVRVMGAWRLGVGVGQKDLFAKNGTL